jgi:hypothetical protein
MITVKTNQGSKVRIPPFHLGMKQMEIKRSGTSLHFQGESYADVKTYEVSFGDVSYCEVTNGDGTYGEEHCNSRTNIISELVSPASFLGKGELAGV